MQSTFNELTLISETVGTMENMKEKKIKIK